MAAEPVARQVPYWEVEALWPEVAPLLQKVVDVQDEWDLESVRQKLMTAPENQALPMQLWHLSGKFAIVTQVQAFPRGMRKCLLFMCGGQDPHAVARTVQAIEAWAGRYMACRKMMISGRRGWLRFLDEYRVTNYVMEKDICN
jgi:hypothetical protein